MNTIEKEFDESKEQEMRLEITKNQILSMDLSEIDGLLNQLENRYLNFKNEPNTLAIAFRVYFDSSDLGPSGPSSFDIGTVYSQYCDKKKKMNELRFRSCLLYTSDAADE